MLFPFLAVCARVGRTPVHRPHAGEISGDEVKSRKTVTKESITMLQYLSASAQFSNYLLVVGNRLLLPCSQIKNLNLPTSRARKIMRVFAGENYVKHFSALVAANRHLHWEVRFHNHVLFAA
jgi:hypothetical protein